MAILRKIENARFLFMFVSEDLFGGNQNSSESLHRYLYANSGPVNMKDPAGRESIGELGAAMAIDGILAGMAIPTFRKVIDQIFDGGETDRFKLDIHFGASFHSGLGGGVLFASLSELQPTDGRANFVRKGRDFSIVLIGFGEGANASFGGFSPDGDESYGDASISFFTESKRYLGEFFGPGLYAAAGVGVGQTVWGGKNSPLPSLGGGIAGFLMPEGTLVPNSGNKLTDAVTLSPGLFLFGAYSVDMALWIPEGEAYGAE